MVPQRSPEVLAMVRRSIRRNPDVTSTDLYDRAIALDPKIKRLSIRQFHGKYPLAVWKQLRLAEQAAHPKRRGHTR